MTEPVLTVDSTDRLGDVGKAMLNQEIKSVVVINEDCYPEGILTSTDFVAIATDGSNAIDAAVSEWMTTDIRTVSTDELVVDAADLMLAENISHLPVVDDDGGVVGILSMTDIVADRASPTETS
jgi:signal-transduction protein with cAMP-binding, CBS, and nucleotidyltransferase domain